MWPVHHGPPIQQSRVKKCQLHVEGTDRVAPIIKLVVHICEVLALDGPGAM